MLQPRTRMSIQRASPYSEAVRSTLHFPTSNPPETPQKLIITRTCLSGLFLHLTTLPQAAMSTTAQPQPQPTDPPTTSSALEPSTSTTSQEAAHRLAEAIDDFLGDLDKKFSSISNEILTRLDDMAERCDRLEQEMLLREQTNSVAKSVAGGSVTGGSHEESES